VFSGTTDDVRCWGRNAEDEASAVFGVAVETTPKKPRNF
jgi:hypothetical protein